MPCGSVLGGAAQNGSCTERESCRAVVLWGMTQGTVLLRRLIVVTTNSGAMSAVLVL